MWMTDDGWKNIIHFSRNEAWGDYKKMDTRIFDYLDAMREYCGKSIIIHCGYEEDGHTTNSQHYLGMATDYHIVGMSLLDQYLLAEKFPWSAIGVYPDWKNPGIHADCRNLSPDRIRGKRWARKTIDGKKEYVALDYKLIKYIVEQGV